MQVTIQILDKNWPLCVTEPPFGGLGAKYCSS